MITFSFRPITKNLICATLLALLVGTAHAQDKNEAAKDEKPASSAGNIELDLSKKLSGKDGIDFVCEADIYYSWRRTPPTGKNKKTKPLPTKENDVFFATVGERGLVGEDVRNRLNAKLPRVKTEARTHCEVAHQDQAKCVSSKLKFNAEDYNMMDFKSRAAFLNAVQEDCAEHTGICTGTKTRPVKCYLNRPPNSPLSDEPEGGEEGKDGKKGKKKK